MGRGARSIVAALIVAAALAAPSTASARPAPLPAHHTSRALTPPEQYETVVPQRLVIDAFPHLVHSRGGSDWWSDAAGTHRYGTTETLTPPGYAGFSTLAAGTNDRLWGLNGAAGSVTS